MVNNLGLDRAALDVRWTDVLIRQIEWKKTFEGPSLLLLAIGVLLGFVVVAIAAGPASDCCVVC